MLSFALLGAYAGVVITGSHNPKQCNGVKVYGEDGAHLTPQFADEIWARMEKVKDIFAIHAMDCDKLLASGLCIEIGEKLDASYNNVLQVFATPKSKELTLVYYSFTRSRV